MINDSDRDNVQVLRSPHCVVTGYKINFSIAFMAILVSIKRALSCAQLPSRRFTFLPARSRYTIFVKYIVAGSIRRVIMIARPLDGLKKSSFFTLRKEDEKNNDNMIIVEGK